jgi:hypothetical protein
MKIITEFVYGVCHTIVPKEIGSRSCVTHDWRAVRGLPQISHTPRSLQSFSSDECGYRKSTLYVRLIAMDPNYNVDLGT